jgi:hypothetical protein
MASAQIRSESAEVYRRAEAYAEFSREKHPEKNDSFQKKVTLKEIPEIGFSEGNPP